MKLYWTYRSERIWTVDLWNLSLNWVYTPSFFLNNQFFDWYSAWLTNIKDLVIPEERYTAEIMPWVPKLTRFIVAEYNEAYVDPVELSRSITNVWARFNIDMFTDIETARQWVRDNCNLLEETPGNFLLAEATTWMMWETIEKQILTIE